MSLLQNHFSRKNNFKVNFLLHYCIVVTYTLFPYVMSNNKIYITRETAEGLNQWIECIKIVLIPKSMRISVVAVRSTEWHVDRKNNDD